MAARGSGEQSCGRVELPSALPFEVPRLNRLSWALGSRTVEDDESTPWSRWTDTESQWRLTIFEVTAETVVIRVRTPVGRGRFYGAAKTDLETALPALRSSTRWQRLD